MRWLDFLYRKPASVASIDPLAGEPLRRKAGKPTLPIWFVAHGASEDARERADGGVGRAWAESVAEQAKAFRNMGVTYSSAGEYGNSIDLFRPVAA